MSITTTKFKSALEAKIAASSGSTSLEDLTIIKSDCDLWLRNNEGGSISGYSSLETLLQNKEAALTASSTLDDITLVGVSAFPPSYSSGGSTSGSTGFQNKVQITSSGEWTVPVGVYELEIWATAGGGGGGGSNNAGGSAGGSSSSTAISTIIVTPGDVLSVVVGAGGNGGTTSGAQSGAGGASYVYKDAKIYAYATATSSVIGNTLGNLRQIYSDRAFIAGFAGMGGSINTAGGSACSVAPPMVPNSASGAMLFGFTIPSVSGSIGGTGNGTGGGGGGGGNSAYGAGGNGGTLNGIGQNAPATSYGSGGGGAAGGNSGSRVGGNGANGIVEIYY